MEPAPQGTAPQSGLPSGRQQHSQQQPVYDIRNGGHYGICALSIALPSHQLPGSANPSSRGYAMPDTAAIL